MPFTMQFFETLHDIYGEQCFEITHIEVDHMGMEEIDLVKLVVKKRKRSSTNEEVGLDEHHVA